MSVFERLDRQRADEGARKKQATEAAAESRKAQENQANREAQKVAMIQANKTEGLDALRTSGAISALDEIRRRIPGAKVEVVTDSNGNPTASVTWERQHVIQYADGVRKNDPKTLGVQVSRDSDGNLRASVASTSWDAPRGVKVSTKDEAEEALAESLGMELNRDEYLRVNPVSEIGLPSKPKPWDGTMSTEAPYGKGSKGGV